MSKHERKQLSIFSGELMGPAIVDAFKKLDPRLLIKNPVMFTTGVVALLLTVLMVARCLESADQLPAPARLLAVADRAVRQFRRGDGRRARQGAGGVAARHQVAADCQASEGQQDRKSLPAAQLRAGDIVLCRDRRPDPCRRRGDRGRRLGQRSRDHRRIRARHPRRRAATGRR